jgi:hypothetical protein
MSEKVSVQNEEKKERKEKKLTRWVMEQALECLVEVLPNELRPDINEQRDAQVVNQREVVALIRIRIGGNECKERVPDHQNVFEVEFPLQQ